MTRFVANDSFGATSDLDIGASRTGPYNPEISRLASGGLVLGWATLFGGVRVSTFDAGGTPVVSDKLISATGFGTNVVGLTGGGYAVAWAENIKDVYGETVQKVFVQVFDAAGVALSNPTRAELGFGAQGAPELTALDNGGFVLGWQVAATWAQVRTFDAGGTPLTSTTSATAYQPSTLGLLTLNDGRVLISSSRLSGSSLIDVKTYDPVSGTVSLTSFATLTPAPGASFYGGEMVQLLSGNVVITWAERLQAATIVRGAVYTQDGVALSQAFSINTPASSAGEVFATALDNGGFAITYSGGASGSEKTFGQVFDASAAPIGDAFAVGSPEHPRTQSGHITAFGSGDFAIAWNYYDASTGNMFDASLQLYYNSTNGTAQADTLTGTEQTEILRGLAGDDILNGLGGNDVLVGGAGADILNGGDGSDTADYAGSQAAVNVDLKYGQGFYGDAEGDTLVSIENISGSDFGDTLAGDANANRIEGGAGNDLLVGRGGADVLIGGEGFDIASYTTSSVGVTIDLTAGTGLGGDAEGDVLVDIEDVYGSQYNDVLRGNDAVNYLSGLGGDDILIGSINADTMDGGTGIDTASYETSANAVRINLVTREMAGGDAQGDTLVSIENLRGSAFADTLTGDAGANRLEGLAGDDTLTGGLGNDVLDGGAGNDIAVIASARGAALIRVMNNALVVSSGDGVDTLTGIETLRFSDGDVAVGALARLGDIAGLYQTYGGRDPYVSEAQFWSAQLAAGAPLSDVRGAILNDQLGIAHSAATITALYRTYFGRAPAEAEVSYWSGTIRSGTDFAGLRNVLVTHPDGVAHTVATVTSLYQTYFGRAPAQTEVNYWNGAIQAGTDFAGLRNVLVTHPDGITHTNVTITSLYETYMGRTPAAAELGFWGGQVQGGTDFAGVRSAIVNDAGGIAHTQATVDALYREYGGRAAAPAEVAFWDGQVRGGSDFAAVRNAILDDTLGQTHTASSVNALYQDYFGRASAPNELATWTNLFRQGVNHDTLIDALMSDAGSAATGVRQFGGTPGADVFTIDATISRAVISSFTDGQDRIDLRGASFAHADPMAAARQVHAVDGTPDVLLTFDAGHSLLVHNMLLNQLTTADFLL